MPVNFLVMIGPMLRRLTIAIIVVGAVAAVAFFFIMPSLRDSRATFVQSNHVRRVAGQPDVHLVVSIAGRYW